MVHQRTGLSLSSLSSQLIESLDFFRLTDPQFHVHQRRKKGHGCCNSILLLGRQRRRDTKVKKKRLADGLGIRA